MGFGLKDRDEDYYDRTAQTIQRNQGTDAAIRYHERAQANNFPKRGGLFGFMGGGGNSGGGNTNTGMDNFARMMGYRDRFDMTDRGGRYASGGAYQGGGILSALANLNHLAQGKEFGVQQKYKPMDAVYKALEQDDTDERKEAIKAAIKAAMGM